MDYIKHYEKIFNDLNQNSDEDLNKKESFDYFLQNGFPVKKKR